MPRSNATARGVRYTLGDTDERIDMDLLMHHLQRADDLIIEALPPDADPDSAAVADLVELEAAYRLVSGHKDVFVSTKQAADNMKTWNVSEFIDSLSERRRESWLDVIGRSPRNETVSFNVY